MKVKVVQLYSTLCNPMDYIYNPWNSPGQNTGVGSLSLIQAIFPAQGSNPGLPRCRQILYHLSPQGSPRILKWVAYPFSSGSSRPRNWTGVSRIAGGFFTSWDLREALYIVVCICQSQSPNPSHPPFPLVSHTVVLYFCVSISTSQISLSLPFF